jgi:hypothetical protein
LIVCLCLLAVWFSAPAQTVPPAGAGRTNRTSSSERFLLIVETSPSMQKRVANVQRTVGQLFSSGLNGQLHPGDTIGVWTYNDELHAGKFPLKRWTPQTSREITLALVRFIQQQSYDKPARLAPVLAQLTNVIASSEKITVLLVSDGSEVPLGTPFDAQIAEAYKHNAAEQQEQSMPFVTILRAARGEFTGFTVSTPPWPVEFPPAPTNPPPVAKSLPVEKPAPPLPVTPAVVPVPKVPSPGFPVPSLDSGLRTPDSGVTPPPTKPPVVSEVAPPSVEKTNEAVVAIPTPPTVVSNVWPVQLERTNSATIPPPEPETAAIPAAAVEGKLPFIPILAGVAVALVGLALLCFALLRRSREAPRVSLITRSMNKDEK